ncbi:MAG TPA: hypothetical protein VF158_06205 [Longimicrobiales bacterium]
MEAASYARFHTLAEFPGPGELSLTRAIVRYREEQRVDGAAPEADDIGVALVVDGDYAAVCEAVDLGSGRSLYLDLSAGVVLLDWVYASTLDYVRILLRIPESRALGTFVAEDGRQALRRYCESIALGVLDRMGFDPFTRPTFLRIGFRDIVRDLDPNEHSVIRVAAGPDDRIEVRFDCDTNALLVSRRRGAGEAGLKRLLAALFPGAHIRPLPAASDVRYQLRFPLPDGFQDARDLLRELRDGLLGLFANFEPERHRAVRSALDIFGPRDTLAQLDRDPVDRARPAPSPRVVVVA